MSMAQRILGQLWLVSVRYAVNMPPTPLWVFRTEREAKIAASRKKMQDPVVVEVLVDEVELQEEV